jgi:hypothetical protein
VPVVALQHLRLQASQLGLVFTSMGIGSLLGAALILPYARATQTRTFIDLPDGAVTARLRSSPERIIVRTQAPGHFRIAPTDLFWILVSLASFRAHFKKAALFVTN